MTSASHGWFNEFLDLWDTYLGNAGLFTGVINEDHVIVNYGKALFETREEIKNTLNETSDVIDNLLVFEDLSLISRICDESSPLDDELVRLIRGSDVTKLVSSIVDIDLYEARDNLYYLLDKWLFSHESEALANLERKIPQFNSLLRQTVGREFPGENSAKEILRAYEEKWEEFLLFLPLHR